MPRQLRGKGGITNITPRKKYGLGSKLKDRFRKLIPNELASVAVKAAPFVAPFNPAIAGLMRGIGRFDQRGSISDALKQGLATTAFGAGTRFLGGADQVMGGGLRGGFTSPLSQERTQAIGSLFDEGGGGKEKAAEKLAKDKSGILPKSILEKTTLKIPVVRALPKIVQEQLLVGTLTSGVVTLLEYLKGNFRKQEPGETIEDYLAARRETVGQQMRTYMDSYFKFDPEYSALDDAGRDAFVARYNVAQGGRVGYGLGDLVRKAMSTTTNTPTGISMGNTLAENIARNKAAQAAFQQSIAPARERVKEQIRKRTPVQEYAMGEDSILGPLSKKAASTIMEGQDKSQAALDVLNKTMAPTGITATDTVQAPTTDKAQISGAMDSLINVNRPTMADVAGPSTSNNLLSLFERYKDIQTPVGPDPNNPDFVGETALGNIEKGIKDFLQSDIGLKYGKDIPSDINDIYASIEAQRRAFSPDLSQNYQGGDLYYYLQNFYRDKYGLGPTILNPGMAKGGMPTGIMRTNKAGVKERDYRDKGGFVPVGIKEKADDVPAMLSKNEFVMTADAVRGAGNGSIEKGAQRMYDTMKRLEKKRA